jgi:hypothetical protein
LSRQAIAGALTFSGNVIRPTLPFNEYLANEKKAFVLLFDAIYHTVVGDSYFYVPFLFLNY